MGRSAAACPPVGAEEVAAEAEAVAVAAEAEAEAEAVEAIRRMGAW